MNITAQGRLRCMAVWLSAALALGGCKTMNPWGDDASLTPAERQMREDERKFNSTVASGVLLGALGGAVVGAVAAQATGGNSKHTRNAAVAGAVVGGTILGVDAHQTAKKQQEGDQKLRAVQSAAADLRQANDQLRSYIANSRQVLNEGKARLASLNADVAARRISAEQAQAARAREERNIASMQETLKQARQRQAEYAQASAKLDPKERGSLDKQIADMNRQIEALENNVAEYNRALVVSRA